MAAISTVEYGDPKTEGEMLNRLSPIYKLDRITDRDAGQGGSRTWESLRCLLRIAVRKQCSLRRNAASRPHSNRAHHPSPLCDAGGAEIAADSRGPSESCIDCPRKPGRDLASGGGKRNTLSYYG